jgi:hypothetical protein
MRWCSDHHHIEAACDLRQQPMRHDDAAGCLDTGGDGGGDTKLQVIAGQREVAISCSGE